MKSILIGLTATGLLIGAPALAKDTANTASSQGATIQENANRHKNPDGTYQGKPVVAGPSHWTNIAPDALGSSGASTGEGGSSSRSPKD
ncbi:hypothetical protein [Hyphomicrobium sp.]|uniref:hypothetical protein n=1 Tax=Hyphomicrobium sp. TaxID=82 RepID=UPI002E34021A|nr:hypothetical protein [Hyphomicrobium sp.]HEX2841068.1 hypothetical protein [Hyphomicrobium sp.]